MSEDVIARRARALEALLSPPTTAGLAAVDVSEPATEPAGTAADGGSEPAGSDAVDQPEASALDDPRESMMVARIGALLGHPGTWQASATSATLPEALLAELRAPAAEPDPDAAAQPGSASPTAAPPAAPPAAAARRRWWPQLRWTPPRLALGVAGALAALLLAVVMFGGDLLGRQDGPERQVAVIQLAGTSAAPQAHARMRAIERPAGWRLVVDVAGLAPAQPDEYYQGWAVHGQEMVPLGTFHMHKQGQVELWSGVPLKTFSRIEVTEQRVGAGQAPGVLVMVGQI
jgi:anti-sigma-K factor RskA